MKKTALFIFSFLILSLGSGRYLNSADMSSDEKARKYYQLGFWMYKHGRYNEAITYLTFTISTFENRAPQLYRSYIDEVNSGKSRGKGYTDFWKLAYGMLFMARSFEMLNDYDRSKYYYYKADQLINDSDRLLAQSDPAYYLNNGYVDLSSLPLNRLRSLLEKVEEEELKRTSGFAKLENHPTTE